MIKIPNIKSETKLKNSKNKNKKRTKIFMKASSQEEWMKIVQTFSKAIYSSLSKEKNIMIRELMNIFNDFDEKLNKTLRNNSMKEEILTKSKELLRRQTELLEDSIRKDGIIKIAKQNTTRSFNDKLARQIEALEQEIKRYTPNYQTSKIDKNKNCLYLIDTKLKTLEDLNYTLLKRSVVVDEGNEVTDQINSEFGSIPGLLQAFHKLTEENEMLKRQEMDIGIDNYSKRRPFSQLTTLCAQTLSILFQNDLKNNEYIARTLNLNFEDENAKDFDEITGDSSFIMNKNDLQSMKMQLEEIQNEIKERQDEIKKITAQVDTSFVSTRNKISSKSLTVDKLSAMCEHLINQLSVKRKINESLNTDIEKISQQILAIEEEKVELGKKYVNMFKPIFDLLDKHDSVYANMYANRKIAKTLQSVCAAFGLDLFYQKSTFKNTIMSKFEAPPLTIIPPKIISPQSSSFLMAKPSPKTKVLIKPSPSMRKPGGKIASQKSLSSIRNFGMVLAPPPPEELPSAPPELNSEEKTVQKTVRKQNELEKFVNFFLLTDCHKLACQIDDGVPDTSEAIKEYRIKAFAEIHRTADEAMRNYIEGTTSKLQTIRQCAQLILVKEKASISTQIDPIPFIDIETMTDPPKKGKR